MKDKRILVLAPHPDDEVLGCGGTIARLAAEGAEVFVVIVTKGDDAMFDPEFIAQGRREALAAHKLLGVRQTLFLEGFPAARLDTVGHAQLNAALGRVMSDIKPHLLFTPFNGDLHLDHRLVFESALVVARPHAAPQLEALYAYETLSETNWNAPLLTPGFMPNTFYDISAHLETKLAAMAAYASQVHAFPHERSLEALRALAMLRGATINCAAAEAFVLVRQVLR